MKLLEMLATLLRQVACFHSHREYRRVAIPGGLVFELRCEHCKKTKRLTDLGTVGKKNPWRSKRQ